MKITWVFVCVLLFAATASAQDIPTDFRGLGTVTFRDLDHPERICIASGTARVQSALQLSELPGWRVAFRWSLDIPPTGMADCKLERVLHRTILRAYSTSIGRIMVDVPGFGLFEVLAFNPAIRQNFINVTQIPPRYGYAAYAHNVEVTRTPTGLAVTVTVPHEWAP